MKRAAKQVLSIFAAGAILSGTLYGCGAKQGEVLSEADVKKAMTDVVAVEPVNIAEEAVALADSAAAFPTALQKSVEAPGYWAKKNRKATIDYSNSEDGYVMTIFTGQTDKRLKVQVIGPQTTYTYNLTPQKWEAFPLSDGNGNYKVVVYENISGTSYATVLTQKMEVTLKDEFAPFLHSNQYVDYDNAPATVAKATQLTAEQPEALDKVSAVYNYVVKSFTYDKQLAATVQSGYLPVLDEVLAKNTGICFDYAAVMTGMLRSQGVPCKLVVGYAGKAYHAWISVYSDKVGWIDGAIYFDGQNWQRMDPTFASSGEQSAAIMQYIGDGNNYSAKYFY